MLLTEKLTNGAWVTPTPAVRENQGNPEQALKNQEIFLEKS